MTAPLVGRDDVLAELDEVLAEGRSGRGRVVLLTGEPGIGKTRLAEELTRRATGYAVHWAWCRSDRTMGSLRTWSSLLRALTHAVPAVSELAEGSDVLRGLVAGTAPAHVHPEAARASLAADVAHALSLARETPRLLVLDDLHEAEASTVRLLLDLGADLRGLPVVVVATARDSAWSAGDDQRGDLLRQAQRIPLRPLTADQVRQLVPQADDRLLARTGGNPLLVTELAGSAEDVPAGLRDLVATRLDELAAETQDVLRAAAVLGPRFRLDVLAEATGVPLEALPDHLPADLVAVGAAGDGAFVHELLGEAVYGTLGHGSRQAWHSRVGTALDGLLERGRMVAPAEVATHLLRAGREHAPRAVRRCLDAAAQAERMQAFEDVIRWYGEALALVPDPGRQADLLVRRARARRGAGDGAGSRADLLAAAELAEAAGRPDLLADAALGLGTGPGGFEVDQDDPVQLDLLRRALATLPEDDLARRAAVTARLSVARARLDPPDVLQARAREAVALGRASGDAVALGVALAALCDATAGPDHVVERLADSAEIVRLAVAAQDGDLELLGRRLRFLALVEHGDRAEAERELRAYEARARQVRHPLYLWYPPLWRAMWAMAEGDHDRARALLAESRRLGRGSPNAELLNVVGRWALLTATGDLAGLTRLVTDELDLSAVPDLWAVLSRALVAATVGDLAGARRELDRATDRLDEIPFDSEWLCSLAQAAETVERLGGHPIAARVYERLLPYAEVLCVEGIGAALRGPGHTFLACTAPDAATRRQHLRRAGELLRGIGATGLLAALPGTEPATDSGTAALRREGEIWAFCWRGHETRVKDSKGVRDLSVLLVRPGQDVSALDLYGDQVPLEHDTGEVLDAAARSAYRRRLAELEAQDSLSEAEAEERAQLLQQLSAAYGLGGRVRRTGSSAEKARTAVTARIRDAIRRLGALDGELGRHLDRSVRTGAFCSYAPEMPVSWHLTP